MEDQFYRLFVTAQSLKEREQILINVFNNEYFNEQEENEEFKKHKTTIFSKKTAKRPRNNPQKNDVKK